MAAANPKSKASIEFNLWQNEPERFFEDHRHSVLPEVGRLDHPCRGDAMISAAPGWGGFFIFAHQSDSPYVGHVAPAVPIYPLPATQKHFFGVLDALHSESRYDFNGDRYGFAIP